MVLKALLARSPRPQLHVRVVLILSSRKLAEIELVSLSSVVFHLRLVRMHGLKWLSEFRVGMVVSERGLAPVVHENANGLLSLRALLHMEGIQKLLKVAISPLNRVETVDAD